MQDRIELDTRSMLQSDRQVPSVRSQKKGIEINPDTSADVCFGPQPPPGPSTSLDSARDGSLGAIKESNWVQIDLGKDDHDHFISPEERLKLAMARQ